MSAVPSLAQQDDLQAHFHGSNVNASGVETCGRVLMPSVGVVLQEPADDAERELRITQYAQAFQGAYEQFQATGKKEFRDEAMKWLQRQNAAILGRSVGAQAQAHAAFERRLDEGVDYFHARALSDRKVAR